MEKANKLDTRVKELSRQLQKKTYALQKRVTAHAGDEKEREKAIESRIKREADERVESVCEEWEAKYQKLEAECISYKGEKEKLQRMLKKKEELVKQLKDRNAEKEKLDEGLLSKFRILMGEEQELAHCSLAELKEWEQILEVSQRKVGEAKIKAEVAQRLAGTALLQLGEELTTPFPSPSLSLPLPFTLSPSPFDAYAIFRYRKKETGTGTDEERVRHML